MTTSAITPATPLTYRRTSPYTLSIPVTDRAGLGDLLAAAKRLGITWGDSHVLNGEAYLTYRSASDDAAVGTASALLDSLDAGLATLTTGLGMHRRYVVMGM